MQIYSARELCKSDHMASGIPITNANLSENLSLAQALATIATAIQSTSGQSGTSTTSISNGSVTVVNSPPQGSSNASSGSRPRLVLLLIA